MNARPVPLPLRVAQVLLVLLGALVVVSSAYFTWVEPPEITYAFDPLVTAWAFVIGFGSLYVAFRLPGGNAAMWRAALALLASHVLFGVLSVFAYDEPESANLIIWDAIIIGLLLTPKSRGYFADRGTARAAANGAT